MTKIISGFNYDLDTQGFLGGIDYDSIAQQAPDYVIYKIGDYVIARPAPGSELPLYKGTDAATIIQSAINQLTSREDIGKLIYLSGEFIIENPVYVKSNICIYGLGTKIINRTKPITITPNSQANLDNTKHRIAFYIKDAENVWIKGLEITSDITSTENETAFYGVLIHNSRHVELERLYIHDMIGRGIALTSDDLMDPDNPTDYNPRTRHVRITSCRIESMKSDFEKGVKGFSIDVRHSRDIDVIGCAVKSGQESHFRTHYAHSVCFIRCRSYDQDLIQTGEHFDIYRSFMVKIHKCKIFDRAGTRTAIRIYEYCRHIYITDNDIILKGDSTVLSVKGITEYTDKPIEDVVFSNNHISGGYILLHNQVMRHVHIENNHLVDITIKLEPGESYEWTDIRDIVMSRNNIRYGKIYLGSLGETVIEGCRLFETPIELVNASRVTILSCRINGYRASPSITYGIKVDGGSNILIDDVHIHHVDGSAIWLVSGTVAIGKIYAHNVTTLLRNDGASVEKLTHIGDLEFMQDAKGVILIDRSTGTKYRLYVDNGSLYLEEVT